MTMMNEYASNAGPRRIRMARLSPRTWFTTYWGLSRSFWSRVMYSSGVMLPFSSRTEFAPASAVNFALGERASNQSTLDLAVAMSLATSVVYPGNRGGAAPGVGAARTGGWLALKPEYAV